jgi:hypothetical protein
MNMEKVSRDQLVLHAFNAGRPTLLTWNELVMVTWTDTAKVHERGVIIIAFAPPEIEAGKESKVAIFDWRTWRLRRKVIGSNGAETQALYENEDHAWSARLFWATLPGVELRRGEQEEVVKWVRNYLIADSKGCDDAVYKSETMGFGMQNSRSSVEVIGVRMYTGDEHNQVLLWCSSDLNLADALTKDNAEARKVLAQGFIRKMRTIKWDENFVSARKKQKLRCPANPAETQADKENETEAEHDGDEVTFDVGDIVEM